MIHLKLPVPPSPNALPSHPMELHKVKNRYRRDAWLRAVSQHKPIMDPPEFVTVMAIFYTSQEWDEDNLSAGMKFVLDCLKQKQTGKVAWKQGLFMDAGYFIDDDPSHMKLDGIPIQAINRNDRRVEIIIRWGDEMAIPEVA